MDTRTNDTRRKRETKKTMTALSQANVYLAHVSVDVARQSSKSPYAVVYHLYESWVFEDSLWYQTVLQPVAPGYTLIVSLLRKRSYSPVYIEQAGIYIPVADHYGEHWKLIHWVQRRDIVLIERT